jgi:hypothetical protein
MLEARTMDEQSSRQPNGAYRAPPVMGESERLLKLAEDLQSMCEKTSESIRRYERRGQTTAVVGLAVAVTVSVSTWTYLHGTAIAVPIAVGFIVFLLVVALAPWVSGKGDLAGLKSRLRRDERALFEVVALLRETQDKLAESEGWGKLQQAEFRIRLSRFDIRPNPM